MVYLLSEIFLFVLLFHACRFVLLDFCIYRKSHKFWTKPVFVVIAPHHTQIIKYNWSSYFQLYFRKFYSFNINWPGSFMARSSLCSLVISWQNNQNVWSRFTVLDVYFIAFCCHFKYMLHKMLVQGTKDVMTLKNRAHLSQGQKNF